MNDKRYSTAGIKETCIARNGERCKDCIYYGKQCNSWKRSHRNRKPCDYDGLKNDIMGKYPGLSPVYRNNANYRNKGENYGTYKEKRSYRD